MATKVSILGSTGSIGTQTLEIVDSCPDEYEVVSLGAAKSLEKLADQAKQFNPAVVAIEDPNLVSDLKSVSPQQIQV